MPSKKSKLLSGLRNAFHSRSGSPSGRSGNTPAEGLTSPSIEDRHSSQDHPVATDPSSTVILVACSASSGDLSTLTKPNLSVEEAKAQTDKHSPLYNHFMTVFNGFTSLAKKVEPCLDGTPFKTPATVFIAIVEAFEAVGETDDKAKQTLDRLLSRMQHVSKYYANATDEDSRVLLDDYVKDIIRDAREVDDIRGGSTLKKLIKAEGTKDKLDEIVARIDRETTDFYIRIMLEIEKDVKDINARLKRINIQSWNRAPSAQYKADTIENQPQRQACTKGTRVEVLELIFEWAGDQHSAPVFWLHGMAGSGKSTIAYTVCQHFAKGDSVSAVLGASFFCSRQVVHLRRLGNIVPTLAYQLARHFRSFAKALDTVDRDVVDVSNEQVEKLLLGPWRDSVNAREDALPPTLIVIDALDEIEDKGGAEFLRKLLDVTSQLNRNCESKLKILVTSRPDPNIAQFGAQIGGETVFRLEDLKPSVNQGDIDLFLKSELPGLAAAKPHLLERLRERSEGLFIYAATVARIFSSGMSTREQASELERILTASKASSTAATLEGVYSLYKDVIQKAIPSPLRSHRVPIIHRIICTQQPLTIAALARLADVNSEEDVDAEACSRLVGSLHAVLYISKSDKCVYVYHKSFSDFILDEGVSGGDFPCQSGPLHGALYRACLRIMTSSLRFNICGLPSSYLFDEEVPNLKALIHDNIYTVPGLEYACRFWTFHILEATHLDSRFKLTSKLLEDFMNEKVIFWIEVINLLREGFTCIERLGHVNTWVQAQTSISPRLKSLVSSVLRLARSFFLTGASRSTPHLYLSCITFDSGIYHDLPTPWKDHFPSLPQICNSRTDIGFRLLTNIKLQASIFFSSVSVAFSPDGKSIAVGSRREQIYVHSASNGQMLRILTGHTSAVTSVMFSCDGKIMASGSRDKSVRIWEALSGKKLRELNGHMDQVCSVAFSPDSTRIASSSRDSTIRLWDAIDGTELQVFQGHLGSVYSVAFSMDGTCIISGSEDRSVRIWDTLTSVETHRLDGHTDAVTCAVVSPVKGQILSGSRDRTVRIWDRRTGTPLHMILLHGSVTSVAFSPDGTRIVTAAQENSLRILDAQSLECMEMLNTGIHNDSAKFSPDGKRIVTGSRLHVCVWDASSTSQMPKLDIQAHTEAIMRVQFLSDGARFISFSTDNTIRVWDALSAAELRSIETPGAVFDSTTCIAVSPNDEWVVLGLQNGSLCVWDISTGQELHKLLGHTGCIKLVALSFDGSRILSTSSSRSSDESNIPSCWLTCIWDASSGENLLKLDQRTESGAELQHATFSSDGNEIISVCELNSIKYTHIHDLLTHEERVRSYDERLDAITLVGSTSIMPDGRPVRLSGDALTIHVRSLQNDPHEFRYTLQGHLSRLICAAFSPGGTQVVSGGHDGSLRTWNLEAYDRVVKWKFDDKTGWLLDPSTDQRLIWVPLDLHSGLYDGELCRFVISRKGSTRVNMNNTPMGERWAECYQSSL